MNILLAVEMVGTYNGLEPALHTLVRDHGATIYYAAGGANEANLKKKGLSYFTVADDVAAVFEQTTPDLVMVGVVAGVKNPGGSGIERAYALAALDHGIPVMVYRDFFGLHPWIDEVARHPRAAELLHFFMFDESTVRLIQRLELPCAEAIKVGSAYYDADLTRDWAAARKSGRAAMGWGDDDFVIVFSPGSTRDRVLETLEPTVEGLIESAGRNVVFVPTFHPKDPDAPYVMGNLSVHRPSKAYDPVIDRLNGFELRVVREPDFRNAVPDGKMRVAAADFIIMNPLSIDTYTAVYAGRPAVATVLSLTRAEAAENRIEFGDLDFVEKGAMDTVSSEESLKDYVSAIAASHQAVSMRLMEAAQHFRPSLATPVIVENLLRVARG